MADVAERLRSAAGFQALLEAAGAGRSVVVRGPAASGAAALAAALVGELGRTALAVCPGVEYAEEFAEDVNLFCDGLACHFPAVEVLPGDEEAPNESLVKSRLSVLRHLALGTSAGGEAGFLEPQAGTRLVCASVNAVLQPVREPGELRRSVRTVSVGDAVAPAELVEWLVEGGFLSVPMTALPGQYSLRGGILDVFSHGTDRPVRIEFFGDEVDSIRTFDRATQISSERVRSCQVLAPHEGPSDPVSGGALLPSYLPPDAMTLLVEPEKTWRRADELIETGAGDGVAAARSALREDLGRRHTIAFTAGAEAPPSGLQIEIPCQVRDVLGIDPDGALTELARLGHEFPDTYLFCMGPAEEDRLRSLLHDRELDVAERIQFRRGRLNHSVLFPGAGIALIAHHRLFGRYRQRRLLRHVEEARPLETVSDLRQGDLVVHVQHGIGRFCGTSVLETTGRRQEHLEIAFADGVRVHVPSDRIEMVHRYIGIGGREPDLSKLHGAQWRAARRRAWEAVEDLASQLLRMQALRETQPGIAFPEDNEWQRQFESEFPYEETEDQLLSIRDVKRDMQARRPMDRLICGDVGYGKTEIAMRAAFKAVMGGRQVAVLVPTTVLAQQHYRNFRERMADYPVRVEMLSRFVTDARAREILEGMATGQVDIVIGTHRLVQDDVGFRNLGLVVIDEEQRFGVKHKQKFKDMRSIVDVLTLTATPIPRTLHMGLMGMRDISSLQTPPLDRQAIDTRVGRFDPATVRHAVLRELRREGQVFLVHNRVHDIEAVAELARALVPEARVGVAHGQMPERRLARVMEEFIEGELQVLVSTTIIENGLDIPNANTLLVHRADLLGLAEMHQLRGRVGRYIHKAYAYFFMPADRPVTPEAEQRLEAIQRYRHLGAGFDIAVRDLEIRGAGNILGPEQSGHMAAVGYNLYCRMLARAMARLKGEPFEEPPAVTINIGLEALLPEDYVPAIRQRLGVYRQIGRACELEELHTVRCQLRDRFGPLGPEAENLLLEAEIRLLADRAGIDSIQMQDGRLFFTLRDSEGFRSHFAGAAVRPRVVGDDMAVLDAGLPDQDGRALALLVRDLLGAAQPRPARAAPRQRAGASEGEDGRPAGG